MFFTKEFIDEGIARYDATEIGDEQRYQKILSLVGADVKQLTCLNQSTFYEVMCWKSNRSKNRVAWDNFIIYKDALKHIIDGKINNDEKMATLVKLDGILFPVASTLLHFIYPNEFPIVDVRTISALNHFQKLPTNFSISLGNKYSDKEIAKRNLYYNIFKDEIFKIRDSLNNQYNLREIDKAIFIFHKLEINPKQRGCKYC